MTPFTLYPNPDGLLRIYNDDVNFAEMPPNTSLERQLRDQIDDLLGALEEIATADYRTTLLEIQKIARAAIDAAKEQP